MPITLNHSNIGVQYNTGSNYIIETVKSDLYIGNDNYNTIVSNNIQAAPVTPSIYIENSSGNVYAVESYTYTGSGNTADYTRVFPKNTVCDILVVGGGGGGGNFGGGGGGGDVIYQQNISFPLGTYNISVGAGGKSQTVAQKSGNNGNNSSISASGFSTITAAGGGGGGGYNEAPPSVPSIGTSSGGGGGGTGNGFVTGATSQYSGAGGNGRPEANLLTPNGGGGGSVGAGLTATIKSKAGDGGIGNDISITGISQQYGGGGGGMNWAGEFNYTFPNIGGGTGVYGGGNGQYINNGSSVLGTSGTPHTGGGGGGGVNAGGSGIVIIRYLLGTIPTNNLLTAEPTVSPNIHSDAVIETYVYTTGTSTTNYTKVFSRDTLCDILIVAGGGGGGMNAGAGGGAGGLLLLENILVVAGTYNITVGKGGAGGTVSDVNTVASNGTNSSFGTYTAIGGGAGVNSGGANGNSGGSGGGAGNDGSGNRTGGAGTAGQGFKGGDGTVPGGGDRTGGGGGGAGAAGQNSVSSTRAGDGGVGRNMSALFGTSVGASGWFAGGGGGGVHSGTGGTGGTGGGGNENADGVDGTGGGGGAGRSPNAGRKGGSGIVIIRYRSLAPAPNIINMNKTLTFNYYPSLSPTIYTLTFPTKTIATINNSGNKILDGSYTITLGNTLSTIVPTQNQNFQDKTHFSPTISIRYNLLNPVLDSIGAQWTYNTSNTNVYHMGSVGIGTTIPEYSLDVRGTIYSSLGGYTSSALTKWSVLSDRRIKENIVKASYDKCLENVKNIELYNFNFKDNCVNTNDRHQLGFIAQEVQQVYPKAVEVSKMILNLEEKIDDLLTLNITQIDYTLYGAVKSLIEKMENIKIKMEQIKTAYDIP
jgi:hypothetical protein